MSDEFIAYSEYEADIFVIQTLSKIDVIVKTLVDTVRSFSDQRQSNFIDILVYIDLGADLTKLLNSTRSYSNEAKVRIGVITHGDLYDLNAQNHKSRWLIEYLSIDKSDNQCMRYDFENRAKELLNDLHYNTLIPHNSKVFLQSGEMSLLTGMTKALRTVRKSYSQMADHETFNKLAKTIIG